MSESLANLQLIIDVIEPEQFQKDRLGSIKCVLVRDIGGPSKTQYYLAKIVTPFSWKGVIREYLLFSLRLKWEKIRDLLEKKH